MNQFEIGDEVVYTGILKGAKGVISGIMNARCLVAYHTTNAEGMINGWHNRGYENLVESLYIVVYFEKGVRPVTFEDYCKSTEVECSEVYRSIHGKHVPKVKVQIAPAGALELNLESSLS